MMIIKSRIICAEFRWASIASAQSVPTLISRSNYALPLQKFQMLGQLISKFFVLMSIGKKDFNLLVYWNHDVIFQRSPLRNLNNSYFGDFSWFSRLELFILLYPIFSNQSCSLSTTDDSSSWATIFDFCLQASWGDQKWSLKS